jgi:hypothetical protein
MNPLPLEQTLSYIERWLPGFGQQVVGATPSELDDLQAAAGGSALPAPYRQYLLRLGHGLSLPRLTPAHYDVAALTARYRSGRGAPKGYWLLGRASADPYYDVYMYSPQGTESWVVALPEVPASGWADFARRHLVPLAGSVAQWLAGAVFRSHCLPAFAHQQVLSSPKPQARCLARCDAALAAVGLQPLWFSDDWCRFYEGPGGAALASEFPGAHTALLLRADTRERLADWVARGRPVLVS